MRTQISILSILASVCTSVSWAGPDLNAASKPIPVTVVEVKADGSKVAYKAQVSSDRAQSLASTLDARILKMLDKNWNASSNNYELWYYLAAFKSRWCKNSEKFSMTVELRDQQIWSTLPPGVTWDPRVKETWQVTGLKFEGCQEPMPADCSIYSAKGDRSSIPWPSFQDNYDSCVKALTGKYPPFSDRYVPEAAPNSVESFDNDSTITTRH